MYSICRIAAAIGLAASSHVFALAPGQVDGNFGSMGTGRETVSYLPATAIGYASTLAPDGTIYLGGGIFAEPQKANAGVARLSADGKFDAGYGTVQIALPGYAATAFYDLAVQPDGKLIGVGTAVNQGTERWLACRLRTDGTLDDTFGDAQTPGCSTPLSGAGNAVGLQSDGRIVIAGYDNLGDPSRAVVIRLTHDGVLDKSFAENKSMALLPEELSAFSNFRELVMTPDDGIAATGIYGPSGDQQFMVAKFTSEGVPQSTFSQDGVRLVNYTLAPPGERQNFSNALAVLPDGSVIVSGVVYIKHDGGTTPRIGIVKLEADGDLSPDFVSQDLPDGQLLIDPCVQECDISSTGMHVLPDGRILLVGEAIFGDLFIPTLHSIRLLPNGQLDPSYAANNFGEFAPGVSLAGWDGFEVIGSLMQGDRIVMTGTHTNAQNEAVFGALRLVGEAMFADGLESD